MASSLNHSSPDTIVTTLSPFERLPPEIRHMVYTYLNFPVGDHLWFPEGIEWSICDNPHVEFLLWRKVEQLIYLVGGVWAPFRTMRVYYKDKDTYVSTID